MTHMRQSTHTQRPQSPQQVNFAIQNHLQSTESTVGNPSSGNPSRVPKGANTLSKTTLQNAQRRMPSTLAMDVNQAFTNFGGTSAVSTTSSLYGSALSSGVNPQALYKDVDQSN